jgi:DNA mismatch repair protein MutS2
MTSSESSRETGVPEAETGTPLYLPPETMADALDALEFVAALDRVASHAAGPLGAQAIRNRRPTEDILWIEAELALVNAAAGLVRARQGIAPEAAPDIEKALSRLGVEGSVLEIGEMMAIRQSLVAARLVAAELKRVEKDAPLLAALHRPAPSRAVEKRLEQSFDTDGYLLDTASPALAAARKEVRSARDRLVKRLESLLKGTEGAGEGTVTVRNGRYVIPLRRDARNRPGGIVHDESASGSTLFVEPAEVIELGNALRAAEAAEEREVLRVLRELTELLRPERGVIADAHAMVVRVDEVVARGRYAAQVDGQVPTIRGPGSAITIRNGRHPLLVGDRPVVPFDLELAAGERTVLISGPNTGGKTVLLKAVGLISAMTQSGIIPPVGGGTMLPVFRRFFSDIGDRQSIAASLSTFSAHVKALRDILEHADDSSLVLLDEVGSGTDPAEGSALAAAALLSLTRRRALTLASTHLGTLKQLASASVGVVNASLEFECGIAVSHLPLSQRRSGALLRARDCPPAGRRRRGPPGRRESGPRYRAPPRRGPRRRGETGTGNKREESGPGGARFRTGSVVRPALSSGGDPGTTGSRAQAARAGCGEAGAQGDQELPDGGAEAGRGRDFHRAVGGR